MSPLSHGLFETFTSGRYYRGMKALKILACNSKHFRIYGNFKKWKIGVPRMKFEILLFFDNFCFKQPLVLKIHRGLFLDSRKSKMTSKLT